MKMSEEIRIDAPRDKVFAALNDPEVLRQAIPGCEDLEQISDEELKATVKAKVGPVSAKFEGNVKLSDIKQPESYTITGEGSGGPAGFAKGVAKIKLREDNDITILSYDVDVEVGGKLAQVGWRLIEGSAKKLAREFFEKFSNLVVQEDSSQAETSDSKTGFPQTEILLYTELLLVVAIILTGFSG
tara:strand:- start:332 stop:889 length:558 start_codon:yes stop_codon:yes gene_type:complete